MKRSMTLTFLLLGLLALVVLAGPVQALTWQIQTVDSAGVTGVHTSLALDGSGRPHISYHDFTNADLKYAAWNGSAWQTETVASAGNVGRWSSLALDGSGRPRISYMDEGNFKLKYAAWDGSSWQIETVDSAASVAFTTSLALDGSGRPRISYHDFGNGDLKYAAWDGSAWQIETVDSAGNVGWFSSLALDGSGRPRITYYDITNGDLKYAAWDGSAWQIETVDSAGDVGFYGSLALDGSGRPHVSYHDITASALKYAAWDGSAWQIETVDSAGDVGTHTSLALDASGRPHISYRYWSGALLRYAQWDGSAWQIETADGGGDAGWDTSLALDSSGRRHISYYAAASGDLRYATGMPNIAPTADAGGPYSVNEGSSVTLDGSGTTDPNQAASTVNYAWDFDGDGQYDDATGINPTFSTANRDGPATVVVGLQVTDAGGLTGTDTATVTANNVAPIVTLTGPATVDEGEDATFTWTADDVSGDRITLVGGDCGEAGVNPDVYTTNSSTQGALGGNVDCTFPDGPATSTVSVMLRDEDGGESEATFNVTVANVAPTVDAGADQMVLRNETANLAGTWTDPAGSLDAPYNWSWDLDGDGTADSSGSADHGDTLDATTTFTSGGVYILTLSMTDKDGGSGSDTVVITVLNQAPDCSGAGPSQSSLWPPNHDFVSIDVLGVTDPDGDTVTIIIDSIQQDEPVDSIDEDGELTVPDGRGVDTSTAEVRAERDETGDGRVYHIRFTADDGHGGTCESEVLVSVPKSKKATAADGGPLYDSTAE